MARADHIVTSKGFRDTVAAVAAGAFILFFFLPSDAFSEYHITVNGNEIVTSCYWVQGTKVFLCEGGRSIELSQVSSIKEGTFSPLEREMHADARKRFFTYLTWVTDKNAELIDKAKTGLDQFETIYEMRTGSKRNPEIRGLTRKSLAETIALKKESNALIQSWNGVRVPDRSLLILGEIETSQLLTVHMSLEERRIYLNTWDPTYLEYTFEHMEQALTFNESFSRAFQKVYGKNNP